MKIVLAEAKPGPLATQNIDGSQPPGRVLKPPDRWWFGLSVARPD